jgi:hypothetical protein
LERCFLFYYFYIILISWYKIFEKITNIILPNTFLILSR